MESNNQQQAKQNSTENQAPTARAIVNDMQRLSEKSKTDLLGARDQILNEFKAIYAEASQQDMASILTSSGEAADREWRSLYAKADAVYAKMKNLQSFMFNEEQAKSLMSKQTQ